MLFAYYNWSSNDLVKYLIVEKGFSPSLNDSTNDTMLHYACKDRHINRLKFLIEECNCSPDVKNRDGDTLLHTYCSSLSLAGQKPDFEMFLYLFQQCHQKTSLKCNVHGITPLDHARERGTETF